MNLGEIMARIRKKSWKTSIWRGTPYTHSATARYRNTFIGVASKGNKTEIFDFDQK